MHYATTYPWTAALGVNRTVGWHTIAFRGNTTTLEIIVDGTVAKVTNGTSLSKIMLRSDPMLVRPLLACRNVFCRARCNSVCNQAQEPTIIFLLGFVCANNALLYHLSIS